MTDQTQDRGAFDAAWAEADESKLINHKGVARYWFNAGAQHVQQAAASERDKALEEAAEICRKLQTRPEFESEDKDTWLQIAEGNIRKLKSQPAQADKDRQ